MFRKFPVVYFGCGIAEEAAELYQGTHGQGEIKLYRSTDVSWAAIV